jgi:hypothetical protein
MYSLHESMENNLKVNVQSSGKGASFRRPQDGKFVSDGLHLNEKVGTAVAPPDDPRELQLKLSAVGHAVRLDICLGTVRRNRSGRLYVLAVESKGISARTVLIETRKV